jgi:hypothetical protein
MENQITNIADVILTFELFIKISSPIQACNFLAHSDKDYSKNVLQDCAISLFHYKQTKNCSKFEINCISPNLKRYSIFSLALFITKLIKMFHDKTP